jgi:hypothetical protein
MRDLEVVADLAPVPDWHPTAANLGPRPGRVIYAG